MKHARVTATLSGGFTLIEMLVVMTLVALLLTLAVPRFFGSIDKSKIVVQQQNAATIRDAIDKFSADLGRYPESLEELVTRHYLRQVPIDPVSETATWTLVAPSDPTQGNVYDILPVAASQPTARAGMAPPRMAPTEIAPPVIPEPEIARTMIAQPLIAEPVGGHAP